MIPVGHYNHPFDAPFEIKQVWDIEYQESQMFAPHNRDARHQTAHVGQVKIYALFWVKEYNPGEASRVNFDKDLIYGGKLLYRCIEKSPI